MYTKILLVASVVLWHCYLLLFSYFNFKIANEDFKCSGFTQKNENFQRMQTGTPVLSDMPPFFSKTLKNVMQTGKRRSKKIIQTNKQNQTTIFWHTNFIVQKCVIFFSFLENAKNLSSGVFGSGNATRPVHTFQYTTDNDIPWQITATVYENGNLKGNFMLSLTFRNFQSKNNVNVCFAYCKHVVWNSVT